MSIVRTNSWEIELNKIDPIRGFHRTNRRNRGEGGLKKEGRREGEIGGIGEGDKRKYEGAQYRGKNVSGAQERGSVGTENG